jgi:hypothetical protein
MCAHVWSWPALTLATPLLNPNTFMGVLLHGKAEGAAHVSGPVVDPWPS